MMERKDMTVAELFGLWFEENRDLIGETARRLYSFYYSQYVSRLFDGRRVKDLTPTSGLNLRKNSKPKETPPKSTYHPRS